ncbi:TcaA 3rd/4th domain-containing protein, partial [Clostridium psychrophilum]|uniref:TcaA 3rd/4th domain-containing protein n=1 Tax=Clostridium psychrophilum TaxID=132926 RepID=UPI001C0BFDDB
KSLFVIPAIISLIVLHPNKYFCCSNMGIVNYCFPSTLYEEVIQKLDNDVLSPKNISSAATSNILTLANIGKIFLIFPNYKISIKPSFVDITTPVKDVTFSINNVQIGNSDTDKSTKEFGPYIPGDYSILANYKGKYVTLNHPYPVDLVATTNGIAKLSVFDDMDYINITSDFPDAKIFVNGKDANITSADATNFGPIDSSTKIYATHLVDGKILKSQEYAVGTNGTDINLSFNEASSDLDNVKTQLNDLLSYYTSSFTEAVNTNDISLIDSYVTYGSELYTVQETYIPNTYEAGIQESIVSSNITDYNISDDNQSGSIITSEVYNIINKDGISSNKTFRYVYKFQYNTDTSSYQFTDIQKSLR